MDSSFKVRVIHRHRLGGLVYRRVSELVFIDGLPKAVLAWIDMAGDRAAIYCDLEPDKLRESFMRQRTQGGRAKTTYYYDEITVNPRYD